MGCDIHARIDYEERRGLWRCVAVLNLDRNYHMFDALAGVRCPHPDLKCPLQPSWGPRGFPEGETPWFEGDEGWADAIDHSATWLTTMEADHALERLKKPHDHCFLECWRELAAVVEFMKQISIAHGGGLVRLVFGFDN